MRDMLILSYLQRLKQDDSRTRFTSSGMQGVVEHGVLFHRTPENSTEQKKVLSVLKYWVIGYVNKPNKIRKQNCFSFTERKRFFSKEEIFLNNACLKAIVKDVHTRAFANIDVIFNSKVSIL